MNETPVIRVAVVEDDPSYCEYLRSSMARSTTMECVACCTTAEDALKVLDKVRPQIVLMDIGLPHATGIDCIRALKARQPHMQFIVLTVFEDTDKIFPALQAGAMGYLLKSTDTQAVHKAIVDVMNGGAVMTSTIARKVVGYFHGPSAGSDSTALTPRERELADLLAQGYSYKEIAAEVSISVETVRRHIHNIYEKLHVRNRTEALRVMRR